MEHEEQSREACKLKCEWPNCIFRTMNANIANQSNCMQCTVHSLNRCNKHKTFNVLYGIMYIQQFFFCSLWLCLTICVRKASFCVHVRVHIALILIFTKVQLFFQIFFCYNRPVIMYNLNMFMRCSGTKMEQFFLVVLHY